MTQHILVVDDEAGIRHLLQRVLLEEQFDVTTAATTFDALSKLQASSFDLAIVDLMLPDVDGLQLAEAIRALDPRTPVILITAYGSPALEVTASHPAVFRYLHKPFSLDELLDLIDRCLPSSA